MLLALLYKSYKNALKSGESSLNARTLGSIESIQKKTGCIKDVLEICKELSRAEMIQCLFADNTIYTSTLTPKAIAYMENRPKSIVLFITDLISKFLPW